MSKKSSTKLHNNLLYEMGQDFLDIEYNRKIFQFFIFEVAFYYSFKHNFRYNENRPNKNYHDRNILNFTEWKKDREIRRSREKTIKIEK